MSTAWPRWWRLRDEGDSTRLTFRAPEALAGFIAPKGSVALNGTSLTVNEVEGANSAST
jgi:riboflavin synthase